VKAGMTASAKVRQCTTQSDTQNDGPGNLQVEDEPRARTNAAEDDRQRIIQQKNRTKGED